MYKNTVSRFFFLVSLTLILLMCGCTSNDPNKAIAAVNKSNIQRLANLYFSYQMKHDWKGPADESAFKEFIRSYHPDKLERIGIDPSTIDELFINERDEQPFAIRYGVKGSMMGSAEPVIFESDGAKGMRSVGFLNMEQREVDESEYDVLWSGKGPSAQPVRQ